jgi:hypothetical protein
VDRVGNHVDTRDHIAVDVQGEDDPGLAPRRPHKPGLAVDEGRPGVTRPARECLRDFMCSAYSGRAPGGNRGRIAAQQDIGVEEREQGLEVAFAGCREERIDDCPLPGGAGRRRMAGALDSTSGSAGKLT